MAKSLIDKLLGKGESTKANKNKKNVKANKSKKTDDSEELDINEDDLKMLVSIVEKIVEAREELKNKEPEDEEEQEDEEDIEDDIDEEDEDIEEEDEEDIEEIEDTTKEVKTVAKIFNKGWFNKETGEIDFNAIGDENVKKAFKLVLKTQKSISDNKGLIENEIKAQLKDNYQLNVSESTFNKLFDRSKISVGSDGKVSGVKEAFEALAKEEPNVFKAVKGNNGNKGNNPLNEGFNPAKGNDGTGNGLLSFEKAFEARGQQ